MSDINSKHTRKIIEAAVELFKTKGYESVSVNDICQASGVARSSFYLVFAGKRAIIDRVIADALQDSDDLAGALISAKNDYERMWVLCCRYLSIAEKFGPELTGLLFRLELLGEINMLDEVHMVDKWMIELTKNGQSMGVILSREPAEIVAPISVSSVYYTTYDWCKQKGAFSLRQRARCTTETILNVAPEYRWTQTQYENADY